MRRHVLTLCLLLPLVSLAQSPEAAGGPPPFHPPFAQKSWVQVLLEHGQELALTDAQVSGLQRIDQSLTEKNAPLKELLEQLRPPRPGPMERGRGAPGMDAMKPGQQQENRPSPEELRSRFETAHSTMEQLRANDEAALGEAEALLSAEQQEKARAIVAAEKEAREKRRQEMHQRMRERMGNGPGAQ
jgi:hypothetical protein